MTQRKEGGERKRKRMTQRKGGERKRMTQRREGEEWKRMTEKKRRREEENDTEKRRRREEENDTEKRSEEWKRREGGERQVWAAVLLCKLADPTGERLSHFTRGRAHRLAHELQQLDSRTHTHTHAHTQVTKVPYSSLRYLIMAVAVWGRAVLTEWAISPFQRNSQQLRKHEWESKEGERRKEGKRGRERERQRYIHTHTFSGQKPVASSITICSEDFHLQNTRYQNHNHH